MHLMAVSFNLSGTTLEKMTRFPFLAIYSQCRPVMKAYERAAFFHFKVYERSTLYVKMIYKRVRDWISRGVFPFTDGKGTPLWIYYDMEHDRIVDVADSPIKNTLVFLRIYFLIYLFFNSFTRNKYRLHHLVKQLFIYFLSFVDAFFLILSDNKWCYRRQKLVLINRP